MNDTKVSYLLASIGISVGLGSLLAGFYPEGAFDFDLSKIGALGMAALHVACGTCADFVHDDIDMSCFSWTVCRLVCCAIAITHANVAIARTQGESACDIECNVFFVYGNRFLVVLGNKAIVWRFAALYFPCMCCCWILRMVDYDYNTQT